MQRLGFYTQKAIQPELPRILHHEAAFRFDLDQAERLQQAADEPYAKRKAELIRRLFADGVEWAGMELQLFLLSEPDSAETLRLARAVEHERRGAWTQGQRYTSAAALEAEPRTTDELAEKVPAP